MKPLQRFCLFFAISLIISLFFSACGDVDPLPTDNGVRTYPHNVATKWNDLFLQIERQSPGYRPGPAPRALAYLGFAAYEACVPGMPEYNSLSNLYPGLAVPAAEDIDYYWPAVANSVYPYLLNKFFPNMPDVLKQKMDGLEAQFESEFKGKTTSELLALSKKRGRAVATAFWNWSTTDKIGHEAYADPFGNYDWQANYTGPGDWVPTLPGPNKAMFPTWGKVRSFALSETDKLSRPPMPYSANNTSGMYSQAIEVYAQNTPQLSYESKWIAEFWSDDLVDLTFSPPSRWMAIALQVLEAQDSDLATALECYAKLGLTLNDAGVACWHSKYYYNVERPVSYIRRVIDPNWKTSLNNPLTGEKSLTPSFPAYPSGHATFGAAGAEALASVFGYSYSMTDRCHENRLEFIGTPRTFGSFYEMAQENAWSRVLLGVHFRMDCEEGMRFGTVIARKVNALPWKK